MKRPHILRAACVGLLAVTATLTASEHIGLTTSAPSPIVHFEASDYTAGTTSWT
ncbi:MAG: hypothetical protein RLY19_360, partial [Actinomycetota bacterium]